MPHGIHSIINAPEPGWSCAHCLEDHEPQDLITHKGGMAECLFHRMCYPRSQSGKTGICEICDAPLHPGNPAIYVSSRSDEYQMTHLARCFRAAKRALETQGVFFDGAAHKKLIGHGTWDGRRKRASQEDRDAVHKFLLPVVLRHSPYARKTNMVQELFEQNHPEQGWE